MDVASAGLHRELVAALRALQRPDGGFATMRAGESEVEPTAVAALALRDDAARAWLTRRQRPDGGFRAPSGRPESPTDAALAALALDGAAASRSLRYAVAHRGLPIPGKDDQTRRGLGVDGGRPHLRGAHVPRV